jgi:hypothetical protein
MIFAKDLSAPESPVSPGWQLARDRRGAARGCISHISADGHAKHMVARTGRPCGLAVVSVAVAVMKRISTAGMPPTNGAFAFPVSRGFHVTDHEHGAMETSDVPSHALPLWAEAK